MRWPWVALATVLAGGCGLLTDDSQQQPEGMRSPWIGFVDRAGIEVCVSGERLVTAARAKQQPLSVCADPVASALPCVREADCGEGEQCLCGRCLTRACRDSTDCDSRQVCQASRCAAACMRESDCPANYACTGGGCAKRCGSDNDCAFGEACSALDGTCIVKLCGTQVTCSATEQCLPIERVGELREPHLMQENGAPTVAYVELRQGSASCAIHRARIVQPKRWELEAQPVLAPEPQDEGCLGAPTVIHTGQGLVMIAAPGNGRSLIIARSADGLGFVRDQQPLWSPQFDWEQGRVGSPSAAIVGDTTVVAYEAANGQAIGLLRLGEQGAEPVSDQPWLTPVGLEDPLFWRSIEAVRAPCAVGSDEGLKLYVAGRGVEGFAALSASAGTYPPDINDSIGLIASPDLVRQDSYPAGPVFARRVNLRAYLGELEPSVLVLPDRTWLVYVAADASGEHVTGLALAEAIY